MELKVKLEVFEGPLDLLLHLLDKNKVDIYDIPIVTITSQYMDYMAAMKENNLDITSEFLVMAATLLDIKSRMLLPRSDADDEEEEDDPRQELVRQLLEYKMYKYMASQLKDQQMSAGLTMYHAPSIPPEVAMYEPPVDPDQLVSDSGVTLAKLHAIFMDVMKREQQRIDPIRAKFGNIRREEISVEDRMSSLKVFASENRQFSFRSILEDARTKTEVIVTFLAVLEMMKAGEITAEQDETFGEITITSKIAA